MDQQVRRSTEVLRIASLDAAISLGMLHRRPPLGRRSRPPLLLVHGATLGAAIFDLPRSGYSLMAEMADAGRSVYAVDIRGFGRSRVEWPRAAGGDPFPTIAEATRDVGAAVSAILAREQVDAIDAIGFSWGSIPVARCATEHPERIRRLALYAPLYANVNEPWLDRIAERFDRNRLRDDFRAYRSVALPDLVERWDSEIGARDPTSYREEGVAECAFDALAALDRHARADGMPAFRCPTGPLADLVHVFNGRPLYDASKITMPTLLVRGVDDSTSTDVDARSLLAQIRSSSKSYRMIPGASHFLVLERNRTAFYDALAQFFAPAHASQHALQEKIL